MIQRGKAFLALALVLMLAVCLSGLAQAEEGEQAVPAPGVPEEPQEPAPDTSAPDDSYEEPVATEPPAQTAPMATEQPVVPLPGTPEETAPPATEAPATPEPVAQSGGSVDVTIYTLTPAGAAASGYTVAMDQSTQTADAQGMVRFPGVNIGQHEVTISSPDGDRSVGRLYMSRGGSTVLTDKAMGGTYGMNIAEGQSDIYLVITFVPGEGMDIDMLSNTPPAIPQAEPSAAPVTDIQHPAKTIVATFLGEDNSSLANLTLTARSGGTVVGNTVTDSRGQATLREVPYGTYDIAASGSGLDTSFELTILPAATTGVRQNAGTNFVVGAAADAATLYLQFQQVGDTLVLTDAGDSPIGGISPMLLGIIIVAGAAVAIVVLIVLAKKRRTRSRRTGGAASPREEPARDAYYGTELPDEDPYEPEPAQPVRRTGGANKYHDRQRM